MQSRTEEEEEQQAAYLNGRRLLLPLLGLAGPTGHGVAKLPQRGIELLWRAYELGHEAALWDLACCVAVAPEAGASSIGGGGGEGYSIDWALAVPLYEKHAKAGHPIAQKNLGTCYFRGWGVPQSIDKATELYQKAAVQNYDVAQYNLGVCYRQGDGVDVDSSRMLELYQKAADQGLHAAQCALAKCYLYGRGVQLDWSKATTLMITAAEGYPAAMVILARWYEVGYYKLMPDTRKAMEYAIRAVYEKEIDAWDIILRLLSRHYEEDKRGPKREMPSLFNIASDYIYQREIVDKCMLRAELMKAGPASRAGATADDIETAGRQALQRERQRRSRLMNVLPVDMQDKLRSDSARAEAEEICGGWKCTLVGLPFSSHTLGGRDEVVLPFCSMDCATFSFERDDQETIV